jgi:glycosyltransferase involved in cell wall biosynthesis
MVGKLTAWLANSFANNIVCVSLAVFNGLERYQKDIGQKAQVIHNGIAPIVVSEKPVSEELSFYLFGRIKPEKGQWFLIESLAKVPKEILGNHKFILVGGAVPGQEKQLEELVQKIETLGLTQNVDIQGFTPNIADAMNKADVCLVPSIMSDPFPTTVLEAMSASKTVITTNNGGAKEAVVDQETGFLIHPNNTSEFANVLTQVIEEKEHLPEWGKAAKKRFSHLFTTQNFNKNWLEFNQSNQLI